MERTKNPGNEERLILKGIRSSMERHVRGINSALSFAHLKTLSYEELLNNCHPTERNGYAKLLRNEGILNPSQVLEYSVQKM